MTALPPVVSPDWVAAVSAAAVVLDARFGRLGVQDPGEDIACCGSGVTACHNLITLERAGLPGGSLFAGSWSAWSADKTRRAAGRGTPDHD